VGWDQVVDSWHASLWDVAIVLVTLAASYALGPSGPDGVARQIAPDGS
jgi:hypothetical protein